MRRYVVVLAALIALGAGGQEFTQSESEVIKKTLRFPDGGELRQLVVDNINGSLDVVGYDGNEILLEVNRTSYGVSAAKIKEAKEKIRLDIKEEPGRVILYVDAPWRCREEGGINRGSRFYGYDADLDFTIKVPSRSDVALRTMNKGDITVENMTGEFEIKNVNGGIRMRGIEGSGLFSTVNGKVEVQFKENPGSRCGFNTVNGSIEVEVPDDLSAELMFKTFNGEMYSDFEVSSVARRLPTTKKTGRRTVYRGNEFSAVRAGAGGPELFFETLNGDIRILKSHK